MGDKPLIMILGTECSPEWGSAGEGVFTCVLSEVFTEKDYLCDNSM